MSSAQRNYIPPEEDQDQFPAPLEYFQTDAIHPDNLALMEHEQRRWRLLGFRERFRLKRYVSSLAKDLKRAKYNQQTKELHRLIREFRRLKAEYRATTFINEEAKREAAKPILQVRKRGILIKSQLDQLKSTYENYQHFAGWLEYEAEHRRDLKEEDAREKKIRREMRREAKWLESLIRDVWSKAAGCHYIDKPAGKKERNITPKFERSVITPDAHWFYLSASKKVMFGYKWKLPPGVMIAALIDEKVMQNLRTATKRQVDAVWSDANQLIIRVSRLDSPDALPRLVKWRDAMRYYPQAMNDDLPYTIGVTDGRRFKWYDFASDPHILVAGKSQSGKSNLVNGIIATLASTHTPEELRLVLIDMKGGVEMTHWEESPHLLWDVVKTVDDVQPTLTRLVSVMRKRMNTLASTGVKSFAAFNKRVDQKDRMERVVIVIDEMNTFVGLKGLTEEIHNLIMLLVSQGRAAGIHVIASTQHPEVAVVPGRIKTNMSIRMSGAMPSVSSSQIILDNPEAARLPNIPGRFAVVVGMETLVVQVPMITDEDIAGVVSSTLKAYPDVANDLKGISSSTPLRVWNEQYLMKSAIDLLEGQISADALHAMLGSESPSHATLRKLKRNLMDDYKAFGVLTLEADGSQWIIKTRKGNKHFLEPKLDSSSTSIEKDMSEVEVIPIEPLIELETEPEAEPT